MRPIRTQKQLGHRRIDYNYDENGNLTDDGTYLYYYDCENRLTDVNDKVTGDPVASYRYDYLGRRVVKIVYGSPYNAVRKYCYDGDRIIAVYNDSDTLLRKFIYGPGIDEPICVIWQTGTKFYYHFDGLGSVVALSSESGYIVKRYSYDVFGKPDTTSTPYDFGMFMFTGRQYDSETGLYYYRTRYYAPDIGRFLQTDPVGYIDGINLYRYVSNNPINLIDPYGLFGRCGPGFWGGIFIPDSYGKADFTAACRHHDRCYEGKTEPNCRASKNKCDLSFHQNLYNECKRAYGGDRAALRACKRRADIYAYVVMADGQSAFDRARAGNPDCCP